MVVRNQESGFDKSKSGDQLEENVGGGKFKKDTVIFDPKRRRVEHEKLSWAGQPTTNSVFT